MTVFAVGQSVATGSGMWVNPGDVYLITGVFLQLTGGSRTTTFQEVYTATDNFVMEAFTGTGDLAMIPIWGSPLDGLTSSDIGDWSYKETWSSGALSQTETNLFRVDAAAAVPEPSALLLLGSVLLGLAASRKLKLT